MQRTELCGRVAIGRVFLQLVLKLHGITVGIFWPTDPFQYAMTLITVQNRVDQASETNTDATGTRQVTGMGETVASTPYIGSREAMFLFAKFDRSFQYLENP